MANTAADMQKLFGRAVLFIFRTENWTLNEFSGAAKFARSLGFDSISPKRAEGTQRWYNTPAQLKQERQAVLAEGCGYAPFIYCDGPKFGLDFVAEECAVVREMGDANDGIVVCDMETEWNGQVEAAKLFEEQMRPWPGTLGVTTWADPAVQNWEGVAAALAPCVNVWIPQDYNLWLKAQPLPPEETIVQPGVDLSNEFGDNNPTAIVQQIAAEGGSAWIWEYVYAQQNSALTKQLCSLLHASTRAIETSGELPTPANGFAHAYVTGSNDADVATVANNLGLSNPYEQLYKPNMVAIEEAVRAAGLTAGSSGGAVLVPGIQLNYNVR